jgi:hypothetical protein
MKMHSAKRLFGVEHTECDSLVFAARNLPHLTGRFEMRKTWLLPLALIVCVLTSIRSSTG